MTKDHIISTLVKHKSGVLQRVAGLFTRRGFNIESITVGESEIEGLARMTIISHGDEKSLEQMLKQLNKLIDVIKVRDLNIETTIKKELCLIKMGVSSEKDRSEIMQYTHIFGGKILDVTPNDLIIEITGDSDKINSFLDLMRPLNIKKISRTGPTAMSKTNGC